VVAEPAAGLRLVLVVAGERLVDGRQSIGLAPDGWNLSAVLWQDGSRARDSKGDAGMSDIPNVNPPIPPKATAEELRMEWAKAREQEHEAYQKRLVAVKALHDADSEWGAWARPSRELQEAVRVAEAAENSQ
jgi:hypothetical protein